MLAFHEITFDILCINKTRLNNLIDNRLVEIPGYDIVRRERNRHGGGVAIYIRTCDNLVYVNRNDIIPDILEAIRNRSQKAENDTTFSVLVRQI